MSNASRYYKKSFIITVCFFSVGALILMPHVAHAGYLDPGSGSTVVQWIIASVAVFSRIKKSVVQSIKTMVRK